MSAVGFAGSPIGGWIADKVTFFSRDSDSGTHMCIVKTVAVFDGSCLVGIGGKK